MEKKYWMINVPGHNGFSIMAHCKAETPDDAIKMAVKADELDKDDAMDATAVEPNDSDIEEFRRNYLIVEI